MTKVLGIANFGLMDSVVCRGRELQEPQTDEGFRLIDVLLPQGILGRITTGAEAKFQRTHTGLSWPLEAKIYTNSTKALRRAPLPVLWRSLVESGDRIATWRSSDGADFSIGKMLAQSVCDIYSKMKDKLANLNEGEVRPQTVIAIPNTLDETGQDTLLHECIGLGMPEPYLIWRPVAVALAWLNHTEQKLRDTLKATDPNAHIHILYFGADALEFTTLRLRYYPHNNNIYILPLRDRPLEMPELAGIDWAGNVIEALCETNDFGAYWQLFTTFPEVWQAIANRPFDEKLLPRPWSTAKGWQFWNPVDMNAAIEKTPARSNSMLREILHSSCTLKDYKPGSTFPNQAACEIEKMLNEFPPEALRGVIVCGPLVSDDTLKTWLCTVLAPLKEKKFQKHSKQAQINTIWLSPSNIAVAEGAAIYGERRLADIPAYLDTMPQLYLFTETNGKRQWHPLLNAQEVLGGHDFEDKITGKFELPSGRRQLEIILCKGAVPPSSGDSLSHLPPELTTCQARLIRHWVRTRFKSYDEVREECDKLESWTPDYDYALEVAENIFPGDTAGQHAENLQDKVETQFRSNTINFPSSPEKDILLDVCVNMKPAAGLAKVSFMSRDTYFLGGRSSIRMNYATMKPCFAPPKSQRSWPALLEICAHPEDPALCKNIELIYEFEKTPPTSSNYKDLIDKIAKRCLQSKYKHDSGIIHTNGLNPFTENGVCCTEDGNELLGRIANKFSQDFNLLEAKRDIKTIKRVLPRVCWMYLATPKNIVSYIRTGLTGGDWSKSMKNILVESAGKCFQNESDIRLLYEHITKNYNKKYVTINSIRSVSRILRYRENAPRCLTETTAWYLAHLAVSLMEENSKDKNYTSKFFNCVLLIIYLLRFRKVSSDNFSLKYNNVRSLFDKCKNLIKNSIYFFINTKKDTLKSDKSIAALKDFEDFVHQRATGNYPQAVIGIVDEDNTDKDDIDEKDD
ncbi:MAG: hypothetical protein LBT47_10880 [Deltaproteobacteria bacterium]|jgi:hypothetical protein|nr:hypothetical protein [Deltaproteobacteria bacterium]